MANDRLTLAQASRRARLSRRQLAYLVRTGVIDADLEDNTLYVAQSELLRYQEEPRDVVQKHHAAKAAMALRPLAGSLESLLFTFGIFGVGLLAVPVMAGASAYAVAELFKWNEGLSKRFNRAKGFYLVIIASMLAGMLLNFLGINPIKALYYAAILNGVIAPVLMFFIFRIGADESIMGRFTSPRWVNVWGWIATVLMAVSAIALFVVAALGR